MERLCIRCVRSTSYRRLLSSRTAQAAISRTFTTTKSVCADDSSSNPKIRNVPLNSSRNKFNTSTAKPSTNINAPPRDGPLLRRTSSPQASQPTRSNGPPQGALLRRAGPAAQPGQLLRRTGPPRQGARPGGASKAQGVQGKQKRRRTAESVKAREAEDIPASEEAVDEYMTKYIDRPENPTERIEYNPKTQGLLELEKDWPNTPLSKTGLSASLIQKIEWLARRIPHGYQTPEQLAEHFQKGNLTRFESEEEKQQVLKVAVELAQVRANALSERKGSEVAAEDMGIAQLNSRDEKNKLVAEAVKGEYGELERQRMPFLESVVRNLRNNETYHKTDADKFMATVQRLMLAQAQRRPQQQQAHKTS